MREDQHLYLSEKERILKGGKEKYHQHNESKGKMFVRDRLAKIFDEGSIVEDGMFANSENPDLPADACLTGIGEIDGRTVCFLAADSTVKAGSWGPKSVEKNIRIQEKAMDLQVPILYLIDSAGARITEQLEVFPGRRHGGKVFYNEIQMSGSVPQICILFGPSPAGAAYVPAFSDLVIMVDQNASAYLGSPRMVEMAIGEKTTMDKMGGAKMHCSVSGLGDVLAESEQEAIDACKTYLRLMPQNWSEKPEVTESNPPVEGRKIEEIVPENGNSAFDMYELIDQVIDEGTWFEYKKLFAPELITGFCRLDGKVTGVIANQPKVKGGTLFVDSPDKAARFIKICNAYNIPLLFLSDIPGYMIGSKVEQSGIIRHGAKMISALSEATVPKISVVVRKCYGAGLYAMAGPAFGTDAVLALPSASIAVMGPQAAVNAVYFNKIQELPEEERQAFVEQKRQEYSENVNIHKLGSELIIDEIIDFDDIRTEITRRFKLYASKKVTTPQKRNAIHPV
ncbi:acyl-CoA carboxylase subunit beta [Pontibacillus yanchengensis]|uniref:Acyl-CoA carboxylase subunit beta n=2 Tax=Pontibacillus yanchengensis TaxID=462910 RepID=A0ACC7VD05_9BACI|nr:acyl-CoA carboxylase subunit beta [Pontibacillus yanchengensis]MYL32087.1 acyl-CoA carboxylase subunit beta [Pontibacillus yanchengensis]MYL52667.1 acyl-CoA carboxylase subunit beta [Pontibacillus yanchengensis]